MNKLSQYGSSIMVLILLFLSNTTVLKAQNFNYVAAAQNATRTQFANMQTQMMQNMFMANMLRWNYKDNMFTNNKLTFNLMMNNSDVKEVKSKIYIDTVKRKTYIIAVDKSFVEGDERREQRIYPSDVRETNIKKGTFEGTFEPKLTTDSCWMFKVINGTINIYSNALAIVAIQKGNNPLLPFNKANLQSAIQDDPKALKFFEKKNYFKAINKYNSNHQLNELPNTDSINKSDEN